MVNQQELGADLVHFEVPFVVDLDQIQTICESSYNYIYNVRNKTIIMVKKGIKMISNSDLDELRRMATNLYDNEKARINRILKGITDLVNENSKLKNEIQKLKTEKA